MSIQRLAVGRAILAALFLLSAQSAWAFCQSDIDCVNQPAPYNQCVNARCGNASCPASPPASSVCIASGGIDDVLFNTSCCSGAAVPGSTCCIYQADWGGSWRSCSQICA
jgi:hypothetical protein